MWILRGFVNKYRNVLTFKCDNNYYNTFNYFHQLFNGVWFNLRKYENKYQKSYDCGMTSFHWNGNTVNRTICEKRRYSYLCFNGEVKFINPETKDGQLFYQDSKYSEWN